MEAHSGRLWDRPRPAGDLGAFLTSHLRAHTMLGHARNLERGEKKEIPSCQGIRVGVYEGHPSLLHTQDLAALTLTSPTSSDDSRSLLESDVLWPC